MIYFGKSFAIYIGINLDYFFQKLARRSICASCRAGSWRVRRTVSSTFDWIAADHSSRHHPLNSLTGTSERCLCKVAYPMFCLIIGFGCNSCMVPQKPSNMYVSMSNMTKMERACCQSDCGGCNAQSILTVGRSCNEAIS